MSSTKITERTETREPLASGNDPDNKKYTGIVDIAKVLGDSSLAQLFVDTTQAAIDEFSEALHRLEKDRDNSDLILEILRLAHNIKAASGAAGVKDLSRFVHQTETVLEQLRGSEADLDDEIMASLFKAADVLRVAMDEIRSDTYAGLDSQLVEALFATRFEGDDTGDEVACDSGAAPTPADGERGAGLEDDASGDRPAPNSGSTANAAEDGEGDAAEVDVIEDISPDGDRRVATIGETFRVDAERLDRLTDLGGELVICKARFAQIQNGFDSAKSEEDSARLAEDAAERLEQVEKAFAKATRDLNRISEEIQQGVMSLRMAPIGPLFTRLESLVQDIAAEQGKSVDLEISGEATELDATWIAGLADPLIHLVRNSVDHGLETEAERIAAGKPARGTVKLEAFQEGQHIVVVVADDGKGVDVKSVRRAIVERELVSAARAEAMTDEEIVQTIFRPGLSTAAEVTELSGRGVGMDIVKRHIDALEGSVEVDTSAEEGTRVTIKIPLSRTKTPSLLATIGEGVFAVPVESVQGTLAVHPDEMLAIHENGSVQWEDQVVPVAFFEDVVDGSEVGPAGSRESGIEGSVLIVKKGEQLIGLMVDQLIGREEVVIKSPKGDSRHIRRDVSASVSVDGRISLNLDVGVMLAPVGRTHAEDDPAAAE